MRTITILSTALLLAIGANAQTTALDFTAADCDGMQHQLFADLDAGNAVIIDLVMMGCSPCVVASHAITDDVIPNTNDPDRVRFYSIGYTNSITCAQMNSWKNTNAFTHMVFAGMSAQTTYYGGMGMPTIIVLGGGSEHGVFYNEQGYGASDNPALIAAINDALAGVNGISERHSTAFTVSPDPADERIFVSGNGWSRARVLDMEGRVVMSTSVVAGAIDIGALRSGAYLLELTSTEGAMGSSRFVKR